MGFKLDHSILIGPLLARTYEEAIDLRVSFWDEELAGVAPNRLNRKEELQFMKERNVG